MGSRTELLQQAVGVLSLLLIGVLLWAGLRPPSSHEPAARATGQAAPAAEPVLVTGRADLAPLADAVAPGSRVAVHDGQGLGTGPGLFVSLPDDLAPGVSGALVLQGGEHDVTAPAGRPRRALEQMVDRARTSLGAQVPVVVVGPVPDGPPAEELLRVRDELAAAAEAKQVPFVDPVELGVTGTSPTELERLAGAVRQHTAPAASG